MSITESIKKLEAMETDVRSLAQRSSDLASWEFGDLIKKINSMLERFAPWKVGDYAEANNIKVEPSSGWYPYRDQLVDGSVGQIKEVDFRDGRFVASWMPLDQMTTAWKHVLPTGYDCTDCCSRCCKRYVSATFEGPVMQVPSESPGHFMLSEKYLTLVDER